MNTHRIPVTRVTAEGPQQGEAVVVDNSTVFFINVTPSLQELKVTVEALTLALNCGLWITDSRRNAARLFRDFLGDYVQMQAATAPAAPTTEATWSRCTLGFDYDKTTLLIKALNRALSSFIIDNRDERAVLATMTRGLIDWHDQATRHAAAAVAERDADGRL